MNPQVVLLGAPGSGKGTQASKMVTDLGYDHISTGDLLRKEQKAKTELGNKIAGIINKGHLVDDQTVLELLKANCEIGDKSYIFDGFPRNIDQAHALEDIVLKDNKHLAIYFEIDQSMIVERIINRRSCSGCGKIYNMVFNPPKSDGKCDACGGEVIQRKDDTEEVVNNRLNVYNSTIEPVVKFYEQRGNLAKVSAGLGPDKLFVDIKNIITDFANKG